MTRAYSQLQVKSFDPETRIIKGIATTPTPDSADDIIEPKGAKFTLPIPFLWQHKQAEPIGDVIEAIVTDKGIEVTIQLAQMDEPGTLKDRLDEAWQSIKIGLVRGLSIGFSSTDVETIEDSWGLRFKEWDWFELSAVTIPANVEATITEIKSIATGSPAAPSKPRETKANLVPPVIPPVGVTTKTHHVVKLNNPTKGGVKL